MHKHLSLSQALYSNWLISLEILANQWYLGVMAWTSICPTLIEITLPTSISIEGAPELPLDLQERFLIWLLLLLLPGFRVIISVFYLYLDLYV